MKRKPALETVAVQYPRYQDLEPRRVRRWLVLGAFALATGALGCDRILDTFRSGSPPITSPVPIHMDGDMAAVQPSPPPQPGGDDDDSAEASPENAAPEPSTPTP